MKCLLAKCTFPFHSGFSQNFESLALGYLAASLRLAGHKVELLDGSLYNITCDEIVTIASKNNYSLIGFSIPDPTYVKPTIQVIRDLRNHGVYDHICVGGYTATFHSQDLLKICPEIDSVVLYEGENTICEIATAIEKGEDWRAISGITFLDSNIIKKNSSRPQLDNLDVLPFPSRDNTNYILEKFPRVNHIPVLSSRGCCFKCSFCSISAFYQVDGQPRWRRRSVNNILNEIEALISMYEVRDILFIDDLFMNSSQDTLSYLKEFAETIIRRKIKFNFTISATVDSITQDNLVLLKSVGLRQVYFGAESASMDILKYMGKNFEPKDIEKSLQVLAKFNISALLSFINFTPFSTMNHLRENLQFFKRLNTNILHSLLNRYQVFGGTPLYFELKQKNRIIGKFPHLDYIGVDKNVDLVYEICKTCLGPLVLLGDILKRVERYCKYVNPNNKVWRNNCDLFVEQENDNVECCDEVFLKLLKGINEDVANIFKRVLDFVDQSEGSISKDYLETFESDMRRTTQKVCKEWINTVQFFEAFCLESELKDFKNINVG